MSRLAPALLTALPLVLAACGDQGPGTGEDQARRGGDELAGPEGSAMSPSATNLAERFDLGEADLVIAPTTYRAQGDLSSGSGIHVAVMEDTDPPFVRVTGSADAQAALSDPGLALSFRLSEDRAVAYAGQTVIVTLVVRSPQDVGEGEERSAVRAAWIAGPQANSGWQEMVLTEDWQQAIFTYQIPEDAAPGAHHIVMLPPQGQAFDLAAIAVRPSVQ